MASENATPLPESNDSRSHTIPRREVGQAIIQVVDTTEPASNNYHSTDQANTVHENPGRIEATDAVDQRMNSESGLNERVVTTEPTSSARAADQIVSEFEDARKANSDGTEIEMAVFRDQNVDHESVLNGSTLPALTCRASPPSYERVMQERSTFVTIQAPTVKEVSTVTAPDNDTITDIDVITSQPQPSSTVNSPIVLDENDNNTNNIANSNRDMSDSDPELTATIDYLRRHRRERGTVDHTECCDNLGLCFVVCYACGPTGHTSSEMEAHANCTRACCEVS